MPIIENVNTIVSVICGIGSIIMFLFAKKEKDKCVEIKNNIDQSIKIFNEKSTIQSKDNYNIEHVKTFDNRKSIN